MIPKAKGFLGGWKAPLAFGLILYGFMAADYARVRWADPRDSFAAQAPIGPFQGITMPDGSFATGNPITETKPGDTIAWISTLCVRDGVEIVGTTHLIHEPTGKIVAARESAVARNRCGPVISRQPIPTDAPPGPYRVDRMVEVREGAGPFGARERLDGLRFTVMGAQPPTTP